MCIRDREEQRYQSNMTTFHLHQYEFDYTEIRSFTVAFKTHVIKFLEESGNRTAGIEFGVSVGLVRHW